MMASLAPLAAKEPWKSSPYTPTNQLFFWIALTLLPKKKIVSFFPSFFPEKNPEKTHMEISHIDVSHVYFSIILYRTYKECSIKMCVALRLIFNIYLYILIITIRDDK